MLFKFAKGASKAMAWNEDHSTPLCDDHLKDENMDRNFRPTNTASSLASNRIPGCQAVVEQGGSG